MKKLLNLLDSFPEDELTLRMGKEPIINKYWLFFGISILLLLGSIIINSLNMYKNKEVRPAKLYSVILKDNKIIQNSIQEVPITLPYAHQSFKNVSNWIEEAIRITYSFDFLNINQQIEKSQFYFTPSGYITYQNSLKSNGVIDAVLSKKLEIATIPTQAPVLISGGVSGETEFWRFRVLVLVTFYGGKEAIVEKKMVDLLVIRRPSYLSPKGLAIAEYNIS